MKTDRNRNRNIIFVIQLKVRWPPIKCASLENFLKCEKAAVAATTTKTTSPFHASKTRFYRASCYLFFFSFLGLITKSMDLIFRFSSLFLTSVNIQTWSCEQFLMLLFGFVLVLIQYMYIFIYAKILPKMDTKQAARWTRQTARAKILRTTEKLIPR